MVDGLSDTGVSRLICPINVERSLAQGQQLAVHSAVGPILGCSWATTNRRIVALVNTSCLTGRAGIEDWVFMVESVLSLSYDYDSRKS